MNQMEWCDNCGRALPDVEERHIVPVLPCDVASANKGESAILCIDCHKECKCK